MLCQVFPTEDLHEGFILADLSIYQNPTVCETGAKKAGAGINRMGVEQGGGSKATRENVMEESSGGEASVAAFVEHVASIQALKRMGPLTSATLALPSSLLTAKGAAALVEAALVGKPVAAGCSVLVQMEGV